jgi:hypothetical protein
VDVWIAERGSVPHETQRDWSIGPKPIIPAPCRCERPHYFRDELGVRCVICARRRRLRIEVPIA